MHQCTRFLSQSHFFYLFEARTSNAQSHRRTSYVFLKRFFAKTVRPLRGDASPRNVCKDKQNGSDFRLAVGTIVVLWTSSIYRSCNPGVVPMTRWKFKRKLHTSTCGTHLMINYDFFSRSCCPGVVPQRRAQNSYNVQRYVLTLSLSQAMRSNLQKKSYTYTLYVQNSSAIGRAASECHLLFKTTTYAEQAQHNLGAIPGQMMLCT